MRQSGLLAAAAIFAIENNINRLADDHANAKRLAEGLAGIKGVRVNKGEVETNIVYADLDESIGEATEFCKRLRALGVWVLPTGTRRFRAVTHLDVPQGAIERAIPLFARAAAG